MSERQEISFLVSSRELGLLQDIANKSAFMHKELFRVIKKVKQEDNNYRLTFSYDILDEFLNYIRAETKFAMSEIKRQRLNSLYDKLQNLLGLSKLIKSHGKIKTLTKKPTPKTTVYIFDIWIEEPYIAPYKPLRKIAISSNNSLYNFAKTIVKAFGFKFNYRFGFSDYVENSIDTKTECEPFIDIDQPWRDKFKWVKKTKIHQAFNKPTDKMLFLYDYYENWLFIIELKEIRNVLPRESLPVVLESIGGVVTPYPPYNKMNRRHLV